MKKINKIKPRKLEVPLSPERKAIVTLGFAFYDKLSIAASCVLFHLENTDRWNSKFDRKIQQFLALEMSMKTSNICLVGVWDGVPKRIARALAAGEELLKARNAFAHRFGRAGLYEPDRIFIVNARFSDLGHDLKRISRAQDRYNTAVKEATRL